MRKVATTQVMTEQASPATPPSGFVSFYAKSDGFLYGKDDAGTEYRLAPVSYVDDSIVDLPELADGDGTFINTDTPGFVSVDVPGANLYLYSNFI